MSRYEDTLTLRPGHMVSARTEHCVLWRDDTVTNDEAAIDGYVPSHALMLVVAVGERYLMVLVDTVFGYVSRSQITKVK